MAERIVDAAFSDAVGAATMFLTDQYVVYDYVTDRVRDGVHPLSSFPPGSPTGPPAGFAPPGPDTTIEAALNGKRGFAGVDYLFRSSDYVRFETTPPPGAFVPDQARSVAGNWMVPSNFTRFSAAWNGSLNRDAFCYLFQGNQYIRYIWDDDVTDAGYPKPIGAMVGMPADFAAGPDAAVDGAGPFADSSYLFLGDRYLPFRWVSSGEPHADGARSIQDGWPGLAELLLAAKAKSHALTWLTAARRRIAAHTAGTISAPDAAVLAGALLAHFKTTTADSASLGTIDAMLAKLEVTLNDSAHTFHFRTDPEAVADGVPTLDAAYASPALGLNFTRNFPTRPELNRVSVMLHESVHVNDPASGTPNVHISEWYVTPAAAPALGLTPVPDQPATVFATRYDLMTTADSLHNPSSYATFARHLFFGHDSRENI